jgi:hypothetical protein
MSGVWYDIAHTNRRTGLKLKCDVVKFTQDKTNQNQLNFHSFSYSSAYAYYKFNCNRLI